VYGGAAQEAARIAEMYAKHDTDRSGGLHDGQLKAFMQEYVKTLEGHESRVVTDEETKYVLSIADTMGDGEVEKADITEAVAVRRCPAVIGLLSAHAVPDLLDTSGQRADLAGTIR
jgi:hypothetical protein